MLKVFEDIKKNVKFAKKVAIIDNLAFRLHYRFTFCVLLICTVLVSSQQYIGEHIRCIADKGVEEKFDRQLIDLLMSALQQCAFCCSCNQPGHLHRVIETFCFFTSTFTVVRHLNQSGDATGAMVPHPGVGPLIDDEPIIRHAYYQWVPFVLFGQALLFYLPHFIWKKWEGGRIKSMASGLERAALVTEGSVIKINDKPLLTVKEREEKIVKLRTAFVERLHLSRNWSLGIFTCELLNLLNLVLQVWLMDKFLGGQFIGFGDVIMGANPDDPVHPMDIVFPKVTKCTFHKYGPSGSLQKHDALCVMALNVINEKIYIFLWFWFIILFVITAISLIYRILSFALHKRSIRFNKLVFKFSCAAPLDEDDLRIVTRECYFSDWLILRYLALSIDGFVFQQLIEGLAVIIDESSKNKEGINKLSQSENGMSHIEDQDTMKKK